MKIAKLFTFLCLLTLYVVKSDENTPTGEQLKKLFDKWDKEGQTKGISPVDGKFKITVEVFHQTGCTGISVKHERSNKEGLECVKDDKLKVNTFEGINFGGIVVENGNCYPIGIMSARAKWTGWCAAEFPWWGILLIVLAVVAVIVSVIVYFCCCKNKRKRVSPYQRNLQSNV